MKIENLVAKRPQSIVLGICTYQRPDMLLRCLSSVIRLVTPKDTRLTLVIVDNEPTPAAREVVECFSSDISLRYVHEPRRGIATARNAILEKADDLGADWIVMLDDDQRVSPDWLNRLWGAKQGYAMLDELGNVVEADVIQGTVDLVIPKFPQLPWAFPKKLRKAWKFDARHAATNGVLFRAGMLYNGSPLRFDERYNFTGGEDRDFFRRAWRTGAHIIWTPEAIAFELLPASRLTYGEQCYRAYWIACVNIRQDAEMFGTFATLCGSSISFTASIFSGLFSVLLAPFAAMQDVQAGRARLLRGSKKIMKATGIAVGLARTVHPEPYRTIHGG